MEQQNNVFKRFFFLFLHYLITIPTDRKFALFFWTENSYSMFELLRSVYYYFFFFFFRFKYFYSFPAIHQFAFLVLLLGETQFRRFSAIISVSLFLTIVLTGIGFIFLLFNHFLGVLVHLRRLVPLQ